MTLKQDMGMPESTATVKGTRGSEAALIPAVDIFEDSHQITVQAEMPGVSKDKLNVQAERNGLLIEGEMQIDLPAGRRLYTRICTPPGYRRSFVLAVNSKQNGSKRVSRMGY